MTEKWCGQGGKESLKSRENELKESDEARDLKTLRLMAKKEYLFACYEIVVEEKRGEDDEIQDCNCADPYCETSNRYDGKMQPL